MALIKNLAIQYKTGDSLTIPIIIIFYFFLNFNFFFDTSKDELYCNGNQRSITSCPPGPENSNILYS